jgi:hypothetical protein
MSNSNKFQVQTRSAVDPTAKRVISEMTDINDMSEADAAEHRDVLVIDDGDE